MNEASNLGICEDGLAILNNQSNKDEMVDYFMRNPDWCLERNYPNIDLLKSEFGDMQHKGLYVGQKLEGVMCKSLPVYVFVGCSGTIFVEMDYEQGIIPMLYFSGGCRVIVRCKQKNPNGAIKVPVYSFGRNDLSLRSNYDARYIHHKNAMLC